MSNLNFGQAIEALKEGKKVARNGWNGKGMYAYLRKGKIACEDLEFSESEPMTSEEIEANVKNAVTHINGVSVTLFAGVNNIECNVMPYMVLKNALGDSVIGWNVSTTDALSEDWCIVE